MPQKIDRRIKKTKMQLQKSLLELIKQKSVKNITIKELVDFADINRSTFYLHYSSIYDVLEEMEQDLLDQLNHVFDSYHQNYDEENAFSFLSDMLKIFFDNQETCNVLLDPVCNTGFTNKVQTLLDQNISQRLRHILGSDFHISSYLTSFYIAGCMGMLRTWQFDENRPSPDHMAHMCYGLIMNTINQVKQISFEELSSWDA